MSELRTLFKRVDYDLAGLLHYIDIGDIGLPDIQRPFVWNATKVRDLFDSMYRGFPVGYLLFWANAEIKGARSIGTDKKAHTVPVLLIVDGQQRLTSLYAIFRGKPVLDNNYREITIAIAFRPRDGRFAVADAAVRRDPEYIPNISDIWASGKSSRRLVNDFIDGLKARQPLTDDEEEQISHNLDRLFDLEKYPFTALEIASTVDEEQVADIFVRINSEGVKLNQADFILTLLSVFWEEGRVQLEHFSRDSRTTLVVNGKPSPYNHFIQPGPDQLLRVAIAVGFQRGRLQSVYQVLRGKDLATGQFFAQRRDQQFDRLRDAQAKVLNLTYWHQFFGALVGAGFRSGEMVSSQNTLLYAYALYLIGKTQYGMAEYPLGRLIGRWFFATQLTGRYTNSPETVMDADLNRVRSLAGPDAFAAALDGEMAATLTNDFWTITLPNLLETSSSRSPGLLAYLAAQNRLGAPVLFSHKRVSELLDPALKPWKKAIEQHHLFPRAWLEGQGQQDTRMINQVANLALLEWPDNIGISDTPPSQYLPMMRSRFTADDWSAMYDLHALPDCWEILPYDEFLRRRRGLMASIIRRGYETLT